MEHSMNILVEERAAIENEINHLKTLTDQHYKQIERLKKNKFHMKSKDVK